MLAPGLCEGNCVIEIAPRRSRSAGVRKPPRPRGMLMPMHVNNARPGPRTDGATAKNSARLAGSVRLRDVGRTDHMMPMSGAAGAWGGGYRREDLLWVPKPAQLKGAEQFECLGTVRGEPGRDHQVATQITAAASHRLGCALTAPAVRAGEARNIALSRAAASGHTSDTRPRRDALCPSFAAPSNALSWPGHAVAVA